MKTLGELGDAICAGKAFDVEVTSSLAEHESTLEPGMRARIVDAQRAPDGLQSLKLDLRPFADHNRKCARQGSTPPAEQVEKIWVAREADVETLFRMINPEQCSIYAEFRASRTSDSYTMWLEHELLSMRTQAPIPDAPQMG